MGAKTFLKKQINCKKIQKVASLLRILFLLISLLLSNFIFSQNTLEGKYYQIEGMGFFGTSYEFFKDQTFKFSYSGDISVIDYGQGHYTLTKDSLFLNYDLTEIKILGYHILKPYTNLKDSVQIDISVYDFNKVKLPQTDILIFGKHKILANEMTDEQGKIRFYFDKNLQGGMVQVIYDFCIYSFKLDFNSSYEIEVYLSKIQEYDIGRAIKNTIRKYKILKHKKNYLRLKSVDGGEDIFKKSD